MQHGARSHAKYSASNAHRVLRCPGQVALSATVPPTPDSAEAIEGERAHELLERSLTGDVNWRRDADTEMIAAVEVVLDWLEGLAIERGSHLVVQVEQPFRFPQDVVPPEDAAGIADIMVQDHHAREAWSVDFKYGAGVAVEAVRNPQLLFNATGRLWRQPFTRGHAVVIQPRIPHHPQGVIRTWSFGPLEIAEFQAEMEHAIRLAEMADYVAHNADTFATTLNPGAWCRFCPAEVVCPARESRALALAFGNKPPAPHQIDDATLPVPAALGLDRVAHIVRHADMLRGWLSSVEKFAQQQAMSGVAIPGHKLVEAQARRRWHGAREAVAESLMALSGYALGLDDVMPRELLDITKADALLVEHARAQAPRGQKQIAAHDMKAKLAFLTLKITSGNLVLVPDTDARPAVDRASVAFAGVTIPAVE